MPVVLEAPREGSLFSGNNFKRFTSGQKEAVINSGRLVRIATLNELAISAVVDRPCSFTRHNCYAAVSS